MNAPSRRELNRMERTRRILDGIQTQGDATGGAGSSIAFSTLEAMERAWEAVKTGRATGEGQPAPTFVKNVGGIRTDMCVPHTYTVAPTPSPIQPHRLHHMPTP